MNLIRNGVCKYLEGFIWRMIGQSHGEYSADKVTCTRPYVMVARGPQARSYSDH
jgi:hypothetical protein